MDRREDDGRRHFTARLPHTRFAAPAPGPLLFPQHTARFATKAARDRSKQPLAHLYCIHPTPLKVASTRDSDVPSYIWTLEPCRLAQVKLQSPCTLLSARFVRFFTCQPSFNPHVSFNIIAWSPTSGARSVAYVSATPEHQLLVKYQSTNFRLTSLLFVCKLCILKPSLFQKYFFYFLSFISLRPEKHETHSFPI